MPDLPVPTAGQTLQALERAGFFIHHKKGSHVHLCHVEKPYLRVVVLYDNRDLALKAF